MYLAWWTEQQQGAGLGWFIRDRAWWEMAKETGKDFLLGGTAEAKGRRGTQRSVAGVRAGECAQSAM